MSTATMDTEEQQQQDELCRLCLKNITANEIHCAIDILDNADVRLILQEVYELKILPDGSSSTMMCMPCYQQLVQDYKFRMKLFTLRKSFKLNQTMLVAQIIAFRDIAEQHTKTKPDGARFLSMRETSTQTEQPESPERCSPVAAEPLENGSDESVVEQEPQVVNAQTVGTTTTKQQLVPLVVDCLKEPRYLKALHPIKVSTDLDSPAPLVFLCSCCYKTFKSQEKLEHHQSVGCVPSCRFCLSEQTVNHSCQQQREYSTLKQHIFGSEKYVTTYAASESEDDSPLLTLLVTTNDDEQEESSKPPNAKKLKLDANHNGRESSSDRRSVTPQVWNAAENHTEPETTSTNVASSAPVITVSSSDDDTIKLVLVNPPKSAAKERPKTKARRKSVKKRW